MYQISQIYLSENVRRVPIYRWHSSISELHYDRDASRLGRGNLTAFFARLGARLLVFSRVRLGV